MTTWAHHHFRRRPWQDRYRCTTCGHVATTTRDMTAHANDLSGKPRPRDIDQPGIRTGVPELTYHSDRKTLSASGAKTLLKDPERFIWERDHGRPPQILAGDRTPADQRPVPVQPPGWFRASLDGAPLLL